MIRPDLRDLINIHKPMERLNIYKNNNNNNNTDNTDTNNNTDNTDTTTNTTTTNNNDTDRGEWKIMLRKYITCISTTSFDETPTQKVNR